MQRGRETERGSERRGHGLLFLRSNVGYNPFCARSSSTHRRSVPFCSRLQGGLHYVLCSSHVLLQASHNNAVLLDSDHPPRVSRPPVSHSTTVPSFGRVSDRQRIYCASCSWLLGCYLVIGVSLGCGKRYRVVTVRRGLQSGCPVQFWLGRPEI